jgi:hypothetical protein
MASPRFAGSGYPLHHLRAAARRFGGSATIPLACAASRRNMKYEIFVCINAQDVKPDLSCFFYYVQLDSPRGATYL